MYSKLFKSPELYFYTDRLNFSFFTFIKNIRYQKNEEAQFQYHYLFIRFIQPMFLGLPFHTHALIES